jgi:hypothetical protein
MPPMPQNYAEIVPLIVFFKRRRKNRNQADTWLVALRHKSWKDFAKSIFMATIERCDVDGEAKSRHHKG